ncbi:hypothetical protein ABPG74_019788 [Tetrahymena malaccensis]
MATQAENILQKILNYQFTVKQRLRYELIVFGVGAFWQLFKILNNYRKHRRIIKNITQYNTDRIARIQALKIILPDFTQEKMEQILNSSVAQLKEMLKKNEVSSEDLVNIFSHRCREIGLKEYHCITEFDYENAIQLARELDKQRLQDFNIVDTKPLYGIPISIKDFFDVKGLPSTVGCVNRINYIAQEDGLSVKLIKLSGGIPFVKTNVPQLGMSFESANRIYGRTLNPWDKTRYPGGSSGGEAVCVATRCSPLGIGSDLGGSIRSPANFNGIYAFKPTSGRVPLQGLTRYSKTQNGETNVRTSIGPIAKSVDDCILFMEALNNKEVLNMKLYESLLHQLYLPFDQKLLHEQTSKKLKIGYFKTFEPIDATLANQRAVQITVDALRELGHEVVEIEIPNIERLVYIFFKVTSSDNLKGFEDQLGDEDYVEVYKPTLAPLYFPKFLKRVLEILLKLAGETRKYKILSIMKQQPSAEEYLRMSDEILILKKQVLKYLEDQEIEAIITPCFAAPALKHTISAKTVLTTSYLYIWNILNFPAGVLPITEVHEDEQHYNNSRIQDSMTRIINENMKGTAKLPVNVQVVTLPNRDELCLNLMKQIDNKVQFYKNRKLPV